MKKIVIGFLAFFAVVVIGIASIPLFYSVDDLRPQIVKQVEAQVRGKVTLGKLSLSTFPSVTVTVNDARFESPAPFNKEPFVEFKEAQISLPLYALLFSPKLSVTLIEPKIRLVSQGSRSSLSEFLPVDSGQAGQSQNASTEASGAQPSTNEDALAALPPFVRDRVLNATVSVALENADLTLYDMGTQASEHTRLNQLNLSLNDIGLNSPMEVFFSTVLDFKSGDTVVKGPVSADGKIEMKSDGRVYDVTYDIEQDLSDLAIKVGNAFDKKAGVDFKLALQGEAKKAEQIDLKISNFAFLFASLRLQSSLALSGAQDFKTARIDFKVDSKPLALDGLKEFLPAVRSYDLKGSVSLSGEAKGAAQNPQFDLSILLEKVTGSTPELSLPIRDLSGRIRVSGNQKNPTLAVKPFTMKVGSSDVDLDAVIRGLASPDVKLTVSSERFNVDELLGTQSQEAAEKTAAGGGAASGSSTASAESPKPFDEALDAMAPTLDESLKNPMLDKLKADVKIISKSLRVTGAEFEKARVNLRYARRKLEIIDTGLNGYKGSFVLNGDFNLVPVNTGYNLSSKLKGVSITEVVATHAPNWKDEISGTINGNFNVRGSGLRKAQLDKNLRGGLTGQIVEGRTSIPVVKLISGILQKLPKKVQDPTKKKTENQVFDGEFKKADLVSKIQGRRINLDKLDIVFASESAGVGEMQFKASGHATFDRYVDMKGTAFLDPNRVSLKELKGPSGRIEIPMRFKGDMSDPKPDYAYSVEILAPRMAKGLLQSKAGQEVKKKVEQEIKKIKAPKEAQQAIDNLKKKFGF